MAPTAAKTRKTPVTAIASSLVTYRGSGGPSPARASELVPAGLTLPIAAAVTNEHLQLIVNTTERCNLRCTYCYETFERGRMPDDVVASILSFVRRRAESGLGTFHIEFFGGEPLVAWGVVETLAHGLSNICRANGVGMTGSMTTNATLLTQPRLYRLVQNGVTSFQITLDGPENIHDKRRVRRNGDGTFAATMGALRMLKASRHEINILVRIHFDPKSIEHLVGSNGFIGELTRTMLAADPRFRVHFHAVGRWGGPNDSHTPEFASPAEHLAAIDKLVEIARLAGLPDTRIEQYRPDAGLGESGHAICYAARTNAFVIRSDGAVSKCTVAFADDRNIVGRLTQEGTLIIDHDRHLPWIRGLISGDARELTCPAVGFLWQ
jgi:uncharacterized protein